jgi:UDP-N-acetylmuramate--alanine ligase
VPTLAVPELAGIRRLHLIGIGGAGMRNLAKLFLGRGIEVSGSDLKDSAGLRELAELGARVHVGHAAEQLGEPDAVVVSAAIPERNPELAEARRRGIPVWARAQALAALASGSRLVAVSGTHGKTTTTSMVGLVLERAGLDPSYLVGGEPNETGSGARTGSGGVFVAEADESDGTFLLLRPEVAVVTNVEVDHVDFYRGGREEIEAAFAAFAERSRRVVACLDDPGVVRALEGVGTEILWYGTDPRADVHLEVTELGPSGAAGVVTVEGERCEVRLGVDGVHMLRNAAATIAAAGLLGVTPGEAARWLRDFRGVHRRFELRGTARGAAFYDDYGHVPTELAVTLEVARRTRPRRIIAVFQPHRYARTQALWRELGQSLLEADLIVVTDVYGAAQEPIPGVTGKLVVRGIALADPTKRVVYLPHRADVVRFLAREVREGDLVLTMGCGDVWMLGDAALEAIREEAS